MAMSESNQSSESQSSPLPPWVNKWTFGAIAVVATVAGVAYTLTRPTKAKKPRRHRPDNRPRARKFEREIKHPPMDVHVVMRDMHDGFHAHIAADKKNKKLEMVVGSALIKINGQKVENDSFETILTKLQTARYPVGLSFREFPELQAKWEQADRLKEQANEVYKQNNVEEALSLMQQAIDLHPTNKVYYSNRVLMLLKKKDHEAALDDCQTMRELDPLSLYVKGHYLRGLVLMNLEKYKHARSAFQTVLKINSKFKKAAERLEECYQKLEGLNGVGDDQKEPEQEPPLEPVPPEVVEAAPVEEVVPAVEEAAPAVENGGHAENGVPAEPAAPVEPAPVEPEPQAPVEEPQAVEEPAAVAEQVVVVQQPEEQPAEVAVADGEDQPAVNAGAAN